MSPVTDYLPAEMTDGEVFAIVSASPAGWITPPRVRAWLPEPPRAWRSAHLRYLERRRLVGERRRRPDGLWLVRLNAAGLSMRKSILTHGRIS